MAADTQIVTVRISRAMKTKLDALAQRTRRPKSHLAAEAIAAYVELNAWQIGEIEAGLAELDSGRVISHSEAEQHYEKVLRRR